MPDEWMTAIDHTPLSLAGAPMVWKQAVINNVLDELEDSSDAIAKSPKYS